MKFTTEKANVCALRYGLPSIAARQQIGEIGERMISTYTAWYTKISTGYMVQLVEWPEVITEGESLEECREMLEDALHEMVLAYQQQGKQIPIGGH